MLQRNQLERRDTCFKAGRIEGDALKHATEKDRVQKEERRLDINEAHDEMGQLGERTLHRYQNDSNDESEAL